MHSWSPNLSLSKFITYITYISKNVQQKNYLFGCQSILMRPPKPQVSAMTMNLTLATRFSLIMRASAPQIQTHPNSAYPNIKYHN